MKPSDITGAFESELEAYSKGALGVMSSKHFVFWRVAITYAFDGNLSSTVTDEVLRQRIETVTEVARQAVEDGTLEVEVPAIRVSEMLRRLKRESRYLSSRRLENGTYEYRVTAAARRAFAAIDELSGEDGSEFGGARVQMILDQIDAVEQRLTTDVAKRASMLDARIAELMEERARLVRDGVPELSEQERLDQLWNLQQIMRGLPADVQSVAQRLRDDGEAFRAQVAVREGSMASGVAEYDRSSFELLRESQQGRSYLDAMAVLGSERMYSIQERLVGLEDAAGVREARGLVSGAWDDLLRSVEQVEQVNRTNVDVLSSYVDRFTTARGRRRTELLERALASVTLGSEVRCPWSPSHIGSWPDLTYVDRAGATVSSSDAARDDAGSVDYGRLAELATYDAVRVLSAMLEAERGLSGDGFVCERFCALDADVRRLVEWGGLVSALVPLGFVETGMATWSFVDLGGNEREWCAPDLYGDFDVVRDFVGRLCG